jgi:hypothetical protein
LNPACSATTPCAASFSQLTNKLFAHLGLDSLRLLSTATREAMVKATFSKTLTAAMDHFFDVARGNLANSRARSRKS